MVKTTVYIDEGDMLALRRLAAATGRSQAEIIREAIGKATADAPPPRREFKSAGIIADGEVTGENFDELLHAEWDKMLERILRERSSR